MTSLTGLYNFKRFLNLGIGVEIEVERVPGEFAAPKGWLAVEDPSLRNNGVEYITIYGHRLVDVGTLVNGLFKEIIRIRKAEPAFEFSERTSVHVHLDARRLSPKELKTLIILYIAFEDALFRYAGEERKHNVFCVPLRYIAMSELNQEKFFKLILQWDKYCALNLMRLKDYGTVEFRHMEGTDNPDRIINWVLILGLLMDYARSHSCERVIEEIKKLKYSSQYPEFIERIFGPMSKFIQIDPNEFDCAISDAKLFFNMAV